jgi:hypothetical protein
MIIAISILFLCGNFAIAQSPGFDKEAEKILMNYISAIGGETALSKIENIVSKSDMSIFEAGVTINREMVQDKANNLYIKAYTPQTGELFRGFDGGIFWEKNKSAVREIDAENRLSYLNEFAFMRFANWKKNLIDFDYLGLDSIDGKVFHGIEIKTKYGVKETWYFDTADYLLSYTKEQLEMTRGEVTVETKFDDYRELDGVKHSYTQSIKMGERNRKITYSSILHNQLIDQKIFSKPISY